jgi:hypothetical protein
MEGRKEGRVQRKEGRNEECEYWEEVRRKDGRKW